MFDRLPKARRFRVRSFSPCCWGSHNRDVLGQWIQRAASLARIRLRWEAMMNGPELR